MNASFFEIFDDSLLVWGVNVLVQWTLVMSATLALGVFFRRQPAFRYGVLFAGLLLVLVVPLTAGVAQSQGVGLFSYPRIDNVPGAATSTDRAIISSLLEQERGPQATTASRVPSQGESSLVTEATNFANVDNLGTTSATVPALQMSSLIHGIMAAVIGIWFAGALLLLVRMAVGWHRMAAILRSSRPTTDETLAATFAEASSMIPGMIPNATLAISDRVSGPLAAGLLRPCVVLPASLVGRLDSEQTRAVLVHELAHLSRRDPAIVLLQNVASAIGWIHPFVFVLNRRLAQAREEICDNYVLAAVDAPSYSRLLLALTQRLQATRPLPGAVGMFASHWTLENRVAGLLDATRLRATRLSARGRLVIAAFAAILATTAALGTVGRSAGQPPQDQAKANDVAKEKQSITVKGRITTESGDPIRGAFVAVIGVNITTLDHKIQTLAEGVADAAGRYELKLAGVSARSHREVSVIARADKSALAWQRMDLNVAESNLDLKLAPEQLIRVRLVDLEGKAAANVSADLTIVFATNGKRNETESGIFCWKIEPQPRNVLPPVTLDATGLLTIAGVGADCGVALELISSDRFARQFLSLNSGLPEERGENDATYRGIVKNVPPGQVATIPLAPATIFEGVVLLGDTGMPAANAPIKIWSGDMDGGSMCGFESKTDAQGRYRLIPYAGVRFNLQAYPPADAPFFPRRTDDFHPKASDGPKNLELRLPAAVLASGVVVDAATGTPVVGASVQYYAQSENKFVTDEIVTGWANIKFTDDKGRYKITIPPGPGTFLVDAAAGASYVLQERTSGELDDGKPRGQRYYAHAFQPIAVPAPEKKGTPSEFAADPIKLHPGGDVVVKLVDESGKAVEQNIAISRLKISPLHSRFRGFGRVDPGSCVEFRGLDKEKRYAVHFLDPVRRLGATARLSAKEPQPTVVLQPCASAKVRILQPDGQPVPAGTWMSLWIVVTPGLPDFGMDRLAGPVADEDVVGNFDRINYGVDHTTDKGGVLTLPALIPGATYRMLDELERKAIVAKEFVAEAGKLHDLGDIKLQKKR